MSVAVTSKFHSSCCYFISKKWEFFLHLTIFFLRSHHLTLMAFLSIQLTFYLWSYCPTLTAYRSIDSMAATKNLTLISFLIFEFNMQFILFSACQACAFLIFMSLLVLSTHDPRYLKSSTFSISVPSFVFRADPSVSMLYVLYLVFLALRARPTFWHSL